MAKELNIRSFDIIVNKMSDIKKHPSSQKGFYSMEQRYKDNDRYGSVGSSLGGTGCPCNV